MKRFVRVLKALGKGILVLLAVIVVALLIMRWVFVRQLNAEIAAIKARGEPLTEADMAGPPVPDAENAALVYKKAFKELPPDKIFWDQMDKIGDLLNKGDSGSLEKARRMLEPYAKAIALTQQVASLPRLRFPATDDSSYWRSPAREIRRLSRLLFRDVQLDARKGDMDGAVDSTFCMFRLPGTLENGHSLIWVLTQETLVAMACSRLEDIASYGSMTEPQMRRLYDELSSMDLFTMHKQSIQWERAHFFTMFRSQMSDPTGPSVVNPLDFAYVQVVYVGDLAARLRYYAKLIDARYTTYSDALSLQHDAQWGIPFYAILTRMLAPVDAGSLDNMFSAQMRVRGSQVLLGLLAYHDRHNAYPSSLPELRKGLGWAIPKDPFSGEEFIYKRNGKGFLLYSVGPDMKDNGGKPRLYGKAYREDAPYDIVWEMSR